MHRHGVKQLVLHFFMLFYLSAHRFAYGEMYMSLATILTRFELELFETEWARDVDYIRDCFLGEAMRDSFGIRVKVLSDNKRWC